MPGIFPVFMSLCFAAKAGNDKTGINTLVRRQGNLTLDVSLFFHLSNHQ